MVMVTHDAHLLTGWIADGGRRADRRYDRFFVDIAPGLQWLRLHPGGILSRPGPAVLLLPLSHTPAEAEYGD